jgi:THO complex subunit 7
MKKYHTFSSASTMKLGDIEDARDAFLVELASFELSLRKSVMVCEAETRQVQEYERERRRIGVW